MNSHSTTQNGKHANLWILDTGATYHISFDKTAFHTCFNIIHVHVNLPDGSHITASMSDSVIVSPFLTLHNVLYMQIFHVNLISIAKLVNSNNYSVYFTADTCQIMQNLSKAMIGTTRLQQGLYATTTDMPISQESELQTIHQETDTPTGPFDSTTSPISNIQHPEHITSSSHNPIHNTDTYSPVDNNQSTQSFPNSCNPISSIPHITLVDNTLSLPIVLTDNSNHIQPMRQSNRSSHPPSYLADYHSYPAINKSHALHSNAFNIAYPLSSVLTYDKFEDFLGFEIARSHTGIFFNQRKYTLDLLEDSGFLVSKPSAVPFDPNTKLFANDAFKPICFNPLLPHYQAATRILRYLKVVPAKGLLFSASNNLKLSAFVDSDWARCPDTRRSVTSYCIILGSSLLCRKSKKQNTVSRSSTEVEYRALASLTCELQCLQFIFQDFKINFSQPAYVFCDRKSTIYLSHNPTFHERSKHIELDCHVIREKLQSKLIHLLPVSTKSQLADAFTKPLHSSSLSSILSKLGLYSIHSPT
ncbi:hypothetical protein KIW84_070964 [Lathyrus oleraceus]|uniref:Retrovirus-related Pol polyprotein from transposon TNT 1-94-like beta-barrel domain-containing protein n=1 Tax=Pisum sativum TaxID=3888 RepID=A0A9D4VI94_PEA|nr:hypothetical protein KIW84_070964 [Pisum sativum]